MESVALGVRSEIRVVKGKGKLKGKIEIFLYTAVKIENIQLEYMKEKEKRINNKPVKRNLM